MKTSSREIGTVRLGNKRSYSDHKPEPWEIIVNIDRPNVLCNQYAIGPKRTRAEAIDLYRTDLDREVKRRSGERYEAICKIIECLFSGHDVILMCWCAPLDCHGRIIKEWVEKLMSKP